MQGKLSEVSNPNISDAGSKNVTENKKKSRKPAVIAVASVAAVAVPAGGGWFVWKTYANHELAEARQACVEASESYRKAADSYSGLVDGDAATASQITVKQVADAKTVDALAEALKANEPDVVACVADSKADYESKNSLIEKNTGWYGKHEKSLEEAVKAVNDSKLEKTVSDAERLLKDSDGKVADNATRDALSNAIDAANGLKDGNDPAKIDGARKTVEDAINGVNASVQAKTDADAQAAAAAAQAQAQAQSAYNGGSSYSGGAYRRTEGSTSGSNTYRGTTSGGTGSGSTSGSGPAGGSAPKPNLNGSYGCGNSCTGKDDGYYHH